MKKLSLILAAILVCTSLAACAGDEPSSTDTGNTTNATTTTTTTATSTTKTSTSAPTSDPETPPSSEEDDGEKPLDELADPSRFTLDGKLDEWEGLHAITIQGEGSTSHKSVSFYACTTTDGVYLACDAYHDVYSSGVESWWLNSNFEFFVPETTGSVQYFVYADGIDNPCKVSNTVDQAVMLTEELTDGPTKYHTVTEAFVSFILIPESAIWLNTVDIGVAWKTATDLIIGGACNDATTDNPNDSDEYWVPVDTWPANTQLTATPKGLYYPDDYFPSEID
ncbi:MAG: hypothetical protein ACI3XR_04760 [Eubacteriales bacterium]